VRPKVNTLECQGAIMCSAVRATLLTAFAVCLLPIGTAHARFSFSPQYGSWWGDHTSFRHNHQHRHAKSESAKGNQPQESPKGPLQIIISITDQRVSLYDNGSLIARSSVSTGVRRHPTPLGVFSVIEKERYHRSNLYSGAPMPYMQRITWSGVAMHEGRDIGHPASHGCIRLHPNNAAVLFALVNAHIHDTEIVVTGEGPRNVLRRERSEGVPQQRLRRSRSFENFFSTTPY